MPNERKTAIWKQTYCQQDGLSIVLDLRNRTCKFWQNPSLKLRNLYVDKVEIIYIYLFYFMPVFCFPGCIHTTGVLRAMVFRKENILEGESGMVVNHCVGVGNLT